MKLPFSSLKSPTNSPTTIDKRLSLLDTFAGLSVASILLPEAVAYAAIGGLPIQAAISALVVGLLCYAILGASRFAIVAPTSSSAALVAAASMSFMPASIDERYAISFALVILTGAGLMIASVARLGRLSAFISRPVLRGFSFALAATIIVKQLPIMLGVHASGANPIILIINLFKQLSAWSWWSFGAGIAALCVILIIKHKTKLPAAFIVLALGIAAAYSVDLSAFNISLVGHVNLALPQLSMPHLDNQQWLNVAELAGGLLVIIFAESWGSIRSLALQHGDSVAPNRELFALGAANLSSGLLQGMPVGAGFSASSANESAGAQSKFAGIFAALCVALLVIFGKSLIEHIPEPVLAAAVMGALLHSLNPRPLMLLWRLDRDQYLSLAALFGVLFFGVLHGMLFAVALSIASAMRAFSAPSVKELVELGDSRNFVALLNHPEAVSNATKDPKILILRPEVPLFFANIDGVMDAIKNQIEAHRATQIVILSLEQSSDVDSSAAENLVELAALLKRRDITLLLARVKDSIRLVLQKVPNSTCDQFEFWSVADAVSYAKQQVSR